NTIRCPPMTNVELEYLKDTIHSNRLNQQCRAKMLNICNHPNYGLPSAGLGGGAQLFTGGGILKNTGDLSTYTGRDGSAPNISSLAGTPRQIQFALKLTF